MVIDKSLRMLKTMFRKHQTAMELDKVVDIPAKIMASYAMYNVQCTMFTLWRIKLTFWMLQMMMLVTVLMMMNTF